MTTAVQWRDDCRNKDVSSWLNARGYERGPTEAETRPRGMNGAARTSGNMAVALDLLAKERAK